MFNKYIDRDNIVAKTDNKIYGIKKYFFFPISDSVSSYRNNVDNNVPRHDANPRKLLLNPKKTIVND